MNLIKFIINLTNCCNTIMIYYESFIPSGSDQPENTRYNARQLVSIALSNAVGRDMSYEYARRMGKRFDASNRKNIIRLHNFSEKMKFCVVVKIQHMFFMNFGTESKDLAKVSIEKVHIAYMKKTCISLSHRAKQCAIQWLISRELVQRQRVFNFLIIQHLIIITCISYENVFAISIPKCINNASF